ncbi:MAG: hypothetical protein WB586_20305 [Chthoniobacterales bacterium]
MDPNVLRLICDSAFPAVLGQGIVWNESLLAPLHVLDESRCIGQRNVVLYQADGQKAVVSALRLIRCFPRADAGTFSVDSDLPIQSLNFAEQAHEGEKIIVQWLTFRRGGIRVETITGKIREIVKIGRYEYRSASAAIVSTRNISAIFLDKKMPPGTSGAPVYRSDSSKILGFVHGNAAANDSLAICLDPRSLWADCLCEHG